VVELILSSGDERILESHRRDISVVFCDLRGFTSFAENSEPEEVMSVLSEYHACLGTLIHKHEGTLDKYSGDGVMVLFNDPMPVRSRRLGRCAWLWKCGTKSGSLR
jgi:class 3 adenylate cyclase